VPNDLSRIISWQVTTGGGRYGLDNGEITGRTHIRQSLAVRPGVQPPGDTIILSFQERFMTPSQVTPHLALRRLAAASVFLFAAAVGACSDSNSGGGGSTGLQPSTTYVGLLASTDGLTGPIDMTFASPVAAPPAPQMPGTGPSFAGGAPVAVNAVMQLGSSGPINLSGTLSSGALHMTGSGWTVDGTLLDGKITGTFTGPALQAGSMSALSSTSGDPAAAYCGTFSGVDHTNGDSPDLGTFSVVVVSNVLLGTAVGDGGSTTDFTGTAGAGTFSFTHTESVGKLVVSGKFNADSTWGSYYTNPTGSSVKASEGTFKGLPCGIS
jgi:hypothetical protein